MNPVDCDELPNTDVPEEAAALPNAGVEPLVAPDPNAVSTNNIITWSTSIDQIDYSTKEEMCSNFAVKLWNNAIIA